METLAIWLNSLTENSESRQWGSTAKSQYIKGDVIIEDKYIGRIYGCYEIISQTGQRTLDGHIIYNCKCIHCGVVKQMQLSTFKYKKSTKCSHYIQIGDVKIPNLLEDKSIPNQRLRRIFLGILRRCFDSKDKNYRFYGEKGVAVCQEWINEPRLFYEWSIDNGYKESLTIDRIQDNKDYSPENCRWVLPIDNFRYKGNTNYITATITLSGRQWSDLIPEHGQNFINTMVRTQGEEKTIEYIENRLKDKRISNIHNN